MARFASALRLGLMTIVALSTVSANAQTEGAVLVPGRPPLTTGITDKTSSFFEWALDVRFTPEQVEEYRQMISRDWAVPQKRKSTLEFLPVIDKLWTSPPETREGVKAQFSQALLESLRKNRDDDQAQWLLAIYNAAHRDATARQTAEAPSSAESNVLAGKWRSTSVAATQYKNSYTGAPAPTSGHSFFYEFLPDGTYQSNNLMQITTYGCTSSIYGENSGHFRVRGDHLYIEPSRGTVKSQVCGGHASEKSDNLDRREYIFHIEIIGGRETLAINGLDGKTRPDYFRREVQ